MFDLIKLQNGSLMLINDHGVVCRHDIHGALEGSWKLIVTQLNQLELDQDKLSNNERQLSLGLHDAVLRKT